MKCQLLLLTHKERYDGFQSLVCVLSQCFPGWYWLLVVLTGGHLLNSLCHVGIPSPIVFIVEEEGEDCP